MLVIPNLSVLLEEQRVVPWCLLGFLLFVLSNCMYSVFVFLATLSGINMFSSSLHPFNFRDPCFICFLYIYIHSYQNKVSKPLYVHVVYQLQDECHLWGRNCTPPFPKHRGCLWVFVTQSIIFNVVSLFNS